MKYIPVKAIEDSDGHWYLVPNEEVDQFSKDLENEKLIDPREFDDKYGQYRTGDCLNNEQLFILNPLNKW
jgi:hypothetical protein